MISTKMKWRKLTGADRVPEIIQGIKFKGGIRRIESTARPGPSPTSGHDPRYRDSNHCGINQRVSREIPSEDVGALKLPNGPRGSTSDTSACAISIRQSVESAESGRSAIRNPERLRTNRHTTARTDRSPAVFAYGLPGPYPPQGQGRPTGDRDTVDLIEPERFVSRPHLRYLTIENA